MPLLDAQGLTKSYGETTVVSDLHIQCHPGEVLGLLGPNGAGKTTTLRMLYGFVKPDRGTIQYQGRDFDQHRTDLKRMIGVCTQEDTLDHDFTVRQNLLVYARYFRPFTEDPKKRADELLERFHLQEHSKKKPMQLSGGLKQRVLIARSLIHRPKILFLDEPTTGLDPRARVELWQLIDDLRADGIAVVLTTHYMEEAEKLSDRLIVLQKGRRVATGTPQSVMGKVLGEQMIVIPKAAAATPEITSWVHDATGRTIEKVLGEFHIPLPLTTIGEFQAQFPDVRVTVRAPNLDDLFLRLSEGDLP